MLEHVYTRFCCNLCELISQLCHCHSLLIKCAKSYAMLFPSRNCKKDKWYPITSRELDIKSSCLIPPVGNCIHSHASEYLFYPISFKSMWKLRPSYSNNSMKWNILMALCSYKLLDMDQIPNCWSQQNIDFRLLERCHIQKNIKCWDLISNGNTFIWYPGNKCT